MAHSDDDIAMMRIALRMARRGLGTTAPSTGLPANGTLATGTLADRLDAIEAIVATGAGDQLQIQRLKKRKLALRDRIAFIEDNLTPDIIA